MKGLLVWAQSSCRSQMALYRELGRAFGIPVEVAVWFYRKDQSQIDNRTALGFCDNEFQDMKILKVGEDFIKAKEILDEHRGWAHFCCNYQGSEVFRRVLLIAKQRGECVAIGSESPCNMFSGWKRIAKEVYFRTLLPYRLRKQIKEASFFVNYSGDDDKIAKVIGWPMDKIVPFGYFPPPLPGTRCIRRSGNKPFEILITGELSWHRGSDIAFRAFSLLSRKGIPYHATITQKGPLLALLQKEVVRLGLPVDFVGFLPMDDLHKAYESCSVYIGAGRHEPWGMRLNDALNCGAPLVVSRGMGGVKMVDEYGCGLAFENENAQDLADKLERLATDMELYERCAANAVLAAKECSPQRKAEWLAAEMNRRWKGMAVK